MLLHHAADEDEPTYFEVDWQSAYILVRVPKINTLVTDRYGEAAGQIIANILQLGHASIGDLASEFDLTLPSKRDSGIDTVEQRMTDEGLINGISKDGHEKSTSAEHIATLSQFHETLLTLLKDGYLVKVSARSYIPQSDLEVQMKETIVSESFPDGKITGPKKQMEYRAAVDNLKRKWQEEDEYKRFTDIESRGTIKRSKAPSSSNKRVKMNGGLTNGVVHHEAKTEDDVAECSVPKLPVWRCCGLLPTSSVTDTCIRMTWSCV